MKSVQWGTRIATFHDFDVYACNTKDLIKFTHPWKCARGIDPDKSKRIADSYNHFLQTTIDGAVCATHLEDEGWVIFDGNHRIHGCRYFVTHDMNVLVHVYKFTHKNELTNKYRLLKIQ